MVCDLYLKTLPTLFYLLLFAQKQTFILSLPFRVFFSSIFMFQHNRMVPSLTNFTIRNGGCVNGNEENVNDEKTTKLGKSNQQSKITSISNK